MFTNLLTHQTNCETTNSENKTCKTFSYWEKRLKIWIGHLRVAVSKIYRNKFFAVSTYLVETIILLAALYLGNKK